MIKARAGDLYLIGLSDINLERLRECKPIKFPLRDLGIELPGELIILWGPTETDIVKELHFPEEAIAATEEVLRRAEERRKKP